ncbi:MAG: hypothetical protein H6821_01840 [Planctomycetaceae bacterium]|nr:hypothetical protein [Planctomycetales bacterium]MCB9872894.1 hypothetical protein [Planctomycetaceae bacterium]MCB9941484.1 hypothetical protein [Planctomycetaceae bacterium]
MNTEETKNYVEEHGIIALRADKQHQAVEVNRLLEQLGNKSGAIPFYAIFPAGSPNKPILLDGVFTSPKPFIEAFEKANASSLGGESLAKSSSN